MSKMWAICKDPGGMNGILPVVRELRLRGHAVLLVVAGKAQELITSEDESIKANTVEELRSLVGEESPSLILTSMCSGGGLGRDLTVLYRGHVPIVALQDYWGARLLTDWYDVRPDTICVNDHVGVELVKRAWPDFPLSSIISTGFPAMDKYSKLYRTQVLSQGQELRERLGVPPGQPVVLVTGQVKFTGELVGSVVTSLNSLALPVSLVVSLHPRMSPEESAKSQEALGQFSNGQLLALPTGTPFEVMVVMADIVVSMFSTVLVEAFCLRKKAISVLYPETGQQHLADETGGLLEDFPLSALGLIPRVVSQSQLDHEMAAVVLEDGCLGGLTSGHEPLWLDGNNTDRAVSVIIDKLP